VPQPPDKPQPPQAPLPLRGLVIALAAVVAPLIAVVVGKLELRSAGVILLFVVASLSGFALSRDLWTKRRGLAWFLSIAATGALMVLLVSLSIGSLRRTLLLFPSPRVEIRIEGSRFVPRGGETRAAVYINDDRADPSFQCDWTPRESATPASPDCETMITQPRGVLPSGDLRGRDFSIDVRVRRGNRRYPGASTQLEATPAARLDVEFEPRGTLYRLYEGDDVHVHARLDGRPPPAGYSCRWSGEDRLNSTTRCDAVFPADEVGENAATKTLTLGVTVLDAARGAVTRAATARQVVYKVRSDYTVFVVEASSRVSKEWFRRARARLAARLQALREQTGQVGIVIFGAKHPRDASGCRNIHTLVTLAPLDLDQATRALRSVAPGDSQAPFAAAFSQAQKSFKSLRGQSGFTARVVSIVSGVDTCRPGGLERFLRDQRGIIESGPIRGAWLEFDFLALTIVSDSNGRVMRRLQTSPEAYELYRSKAFVLLSAKNVDQLAALVRLVADLGLDDAQKRSEACAGLVNYALTEDRDKAGAATMKRYCEQLRTS
jgi:hypothetical protein